MRYGKKFLLGIGITENNLPGEEENFRSLVSRNALNMQCDFQTLIFKASDSIKGTSFSFARTIKMLAEGEGNVNHAISEISLLADSHLLKS